MPRYIPPALKAHLQSDATTTTILVRFDPVTPGFAPYGATLLDRNVVYDDGVSELEYLAPVGMQPPSMMGDAALDAGLDTTEHLLPEYDFPISEEDIRAGAYDFARYTAYLVNYEDLSMGHITLRHGTIGRVTIRSDGLSFVNELRTLAAQLKQSVCEKDSLTCRAVFGSQPPGSSVPGPQVQWGWCGYPAETLLVAGTVDDVGLEPHTLFKVAPFVEPARALNPGIVKFTTGRNAGRTIEITDNDADGWITLAYDLPYPVEVGDEVEYRVDCSKIARDDAKGCRHHFGAEWVLHFRGEPDIPIGDEGAMSMPGAGLGPGDGGATTQPYEELPE